MRNAVPFWMWMLWVWLAGCQDPRPTPIKTTAETRVDSVGSDWQPMLVDYKSDTYKIVIGERFNPKTQVVDWRWDVNDPDYREDSTGKNVYLYLGEPLIQYEGSEFLPALWLETDQQIISSFTCSILFSLGDSPHAKADFLHLIAKDIQILRLPAVVEAICREGCFEAGTPSVLVEINLETGSDTDFDRFEYMASLRQSPRRPT